MSDEPKRYVINSIADFLNVPEERQEQCLKEFALFLHMARFVQLIGDEVKKDCIRIGAFEWIDDGDLHIRCKLLPEDVRPKEKDGIRTE